MANSGPRDKQEVDFYFLVAFWFTILVQNLPNMAILPKPQEKNKQPHIAKIVLQGRYLPCGETQGWGKNHILQNSSRLTERKSVNKESCNSKSEKNK